MAEWVVDVAQTDRELLERLWSLKNKDEAKFEGSSLSVYNLKTLEPGQWLNDEVINTYAKLLPWGKHDIVLDTQVSVKLEARDHGALRNWVARALEQKNKKRKKTRRAGRQRLGISNRIVIPYHDETKNHWVLVCINIMAARIELYDSLHCRARSKAILYNIAFMFGPLLPYPPLVLRNCRAPRQHNSSDCGIAVCMSMLALATRRPIPRSFSKAQWSELRTRVAVEVTKGKLYPIL